MKALLLYLFLIGFSANSLAQQDPITTQFWNHYTHSNPAMSGLLYKHSASATYRNQWVNVDGAPVTFFGNYDTRLGEHHGLGINYRYDHIGFIKEHMAHLNYNYQIHLDNTDKNILSFGVGVGIQQLSYDYSKTIFPTNLTYEIDPNANDKSPASNFNVGVAYTNRKLTLGFGITKLFQQRLSNGFHNARHYRLITEYDFRITRKLTLKPMLNIQTEGSFISANLTLLASLKDQYWIGIGYRTNEAVNFMIGLDIRKKFRIGYSYDYSMHKLSSISKGSHEIVFGIYLGKFKRKYHHSGGGTPVF